MKKLTFKQYVESKERLKRAIQETPIVSTNYTVKKYCKIRYGESKDARQELALKPTQEIVVEWQYEDIKNPEPVSITFPDFSPEENEVYWSGKKLKEWLHKNAIEEFI